MKIISGGQTGADIAGLRSAKKAGIETGGFIPKGFLTLDGKKPEYKNLYGLTETKSEYYNVRTGMNVENSDCTLWFGENKYSNGKQCTFKNIRLYNKPYMDIDIKKMPDINTIIDWINDNDYKIINIAGNSETTTKGIQVVVEKYLDKLFSKLIESQE